MARRICRAKNGRFKKCRSGGSRKRTRRTSRKAARPSRKGCKTVGKATALRKSGKNKGTPKKGCRALGRGRYRCC